MKFFLYFCKLKNINNHIKKNNTIMTKAEIVNEISIKTGIERVAVMAVIEEFMSTVKDNMAEGNEVFLRGFGSFIIKHRAEKTGRNITKNTAVVVPAHNIPAFKPCKEFMAMVKEGVK